MQKIVAVLGFILLCFGLIVAVYSVEKTTWWGHTFIDQPYLEEGVYMSMFGFIIMALGFMMSSKKPSFTQTKSTSKAFCPYCGTKIEYNSQNCVKCGAKIE
jgi:uncharacterized membrane protein